MQRLFSMFPGGTAGAALLVLRVSVAASLLVAAHKAWATSLYTILLFLLPAICLCVGFLTPYFSGFSLLVQMIAFLMLPGRNEFYLMQSIVACGVLATLGPGAYSVDAHLFGLKLLQLPRRKL